MSMLSLKMRYVDRFGILHAAIIPSCKGSKTFPTKTSRDVGMVMGLPSAVRLGTFQGIPSCDGSPHDVE